MYQEMNTKITKTGWTYWAHEKAWVAEEHIWGIFRKEINGQSTFNCPCCRVIIKSSLFWSSGLPEPEYKNNFSMIWRKNCPTCHINLILVRKK